MPTFSKVLLSGSTNGKNIAVAATSSPGTTIHTVAAGTGGMDEIWLYATNVSGSPVTLTVQFGGTATADSITVSVPAQSGLSVLLPGLALNNGLSVLAYAGTANVINISGYANRIA